MQGVCAGLLGLGLGATLSGALALVQKHLQSDGMVWVMGVGGIRGSRSWCKWFKSPRWSAVLLTEIPCC